MNFDFTAEQYTLRDAARAFFAAVCPPAHVRAMWSDDTGRRRGLWRAMAELGLLAVTIPECHGGLGLDEIDLVLVLEEAGRAALPEPLLETAAVAAPLLREAGTPEQQERWLPRIAGGEAIVTVQLAGAPLVADAHVADLLLAGRGDELHAIPRDRFTVTACPSMDGARRLFRVAADAGDDTRMAGGPNAATAAFQRGATATAAVLNGVSGRLLDMTVAYVAARRQFGRPVGSFQAVQHKLAEALLLVETARPAAWYAAYAIARGLADRGIAAAVAKAAASDAAAKANDEALQCHGGIGFTWEHDLHLWLKRGKALEQAYGSARFHRQHLAAGLFASR
jgi:alkylation response protein AidB-like acyl-CoA dehydrogenase